MSAVEQTPGVRALTREDLEAHWMPFTANRNFKAKPRMLSHAKGMHYWTPEGRQILDGVAGLWCVNAGHGRPQPQDLVTGNGAGRGSPAPYP